MQFNKIIIHAIRHRCLYKSTSAAASSSSNFRSYDLDKERSLVKIKGNDSFKYLQNLLTNDVQLLNEKASIYSMILNNRGRVVYDVLVYNLAASGGEYLLEVDTAYLKDFLKMLSWYKIKKRVEIADATHEYKLYSIFSDQNQKDHLVINSKMSKDELICVLDPRYSGLGYRVLVKSQNYLNSCFTTEITPDLNKSSYKKHLYRQGIAENHDDIPYGHAIPLEYNLVLLNGVSFSKGCYLGQELIAKTHHTGVIRKRILPITLNEYNVNIQKNNEIINVKTGRSAGKLANIVENVGIAMLRINELEDHANLAVVDNLKNNYPIKFSVPEYWQNDLNLIDSLRKLNVKLNF